MLTGNLQELIFHNFLYEQLYLQWEVHFRKLF